MSNLSYSEQENEIADLRWHLENAEEIARYLDVEAENLDLSEVIEIFEDGSIWELAIWD